MADADRFRAQSSHNLECSCIPEDVWSKIYRHLLYQHLVINRYLLIATFCSQSATRTTIRAARKAPLIDRASQDTKYWLCEASLHCLSPVCKASPYHHTTQGDPRSFTLGFSVQNPGLMFETVGRVCKRQDIRCLFPFLRSWPPNQYHLITPVLQHILPRVADAVSTLISIEPITLKALSPYPYTERLLSAEPKKQTLKSSR